MRFYINTDKLITALQPANVIATKNVDKKWGWADMITIDSNTDGITVSAYQRDIHVITDISEDNCYGLGYLCLEKGAATVNVVDFINVLRSFPSSENILICGSGEELRLTSSSDEDEFQTVQSFDEYIPLPNVATKFKHKFTIDSKVFGKGIKKVAFAMGEFETQSYYMCLFLEVSKNKVRFSAGSGARFAVHDVDGKKLTNASKSVSVLFPKYTIAILESILPKVSPGKIVIKQTEMTSGGINQVILEIDGSKIVISNLDASINYPPVDKIINNNYPYKISAKTSDFQQAFSGISATVTKRFKEEKDICISTVTANLARGYFTIDATTTISSSRKVCFSGGILVIDKSVGRGHKPWFRCNALYLREMVSKAGKDDDITISFEDRVETGEKINQKPVVVEYPEVANEDEGTKEKFCMFFGTSNR